MHRVSIFLSFILVFQHYTFSCSISLMLHGIDFANRLILFAGILISAFRYFDKDNDEKITLEDLTSGISALGKENN